MSIMAPEGFTASAVAAGIKKDTQRLDLALIAAAQPCAAAAVFTTNRAQAAPVLVSREHIASGRARAIVINAGCANAGTGEGGLEDTRETARLVAQALACRPQEVLVASTGVIGVRLPMDKIRAAIPTLASSLSRDNGGEVARAILTTDTCAKEVVVEFPVGQATARIGAIAKGAGMIAPNMATLLAFFTTDAAIVSPLLRLALKEAVDATLNRITVDGDTSTNDTAVILASGALGNAPIVDQGRDYDAFRFALKEAARRLADLLIRDGEGVTRVAEVCVEGLRSAAEADRIARVVAESPLVKTALNGGDPNWGRILAAAGRAGVDVNMNAVDIFLGDVWVAEHGAARDYDEAEAVRALREDPVRVRVRFHDGAASGVVWTCDLSQAYVDINGSYRS
ncbi:MAG: bifunctional glutamate N-acetyltransferase/amino-acid acetyltransferase ArgJ [Vicinamibacteria bacterium]|jgi:glutamate N-acetyltransferase/amino-acid N-acetyltransferase|nr:bifunctional glutamate N-acetyltransferase/amino-acid acetyltransferase ArgJ [Vicinamibacteria bacterium]